MVFDDGDEFVLGVAIGALIGAGVALLLAPDSGKRTRRSSPWWISSGRGKLRRRSGS